MVLKFSSSQGSHSLFEGMRLHQIIFRSSLQGKGKRTIYRKQAPRRACSPAPKCQMRKVTEVILLIHKRKDIDYSVSVPLQFEQLTREMEVKVHTGVPATETFKFLFDHLSENTQCMQYWRGGKLLS